MTQLFLIHSDTDTPCAVQVRRDLTAQGYTVWQASGTAPGPANAQRERADGIRGSSAFVLVWSTAAAQSPAITQDIADALRYHRPLLPIITDGTALPPALSSVTAIGNAPPCDDAVAQLLPHLPPPDHDDPLLRLLTHAQSSERVQGIEQAALLLASGERQDELLALLTDISHHDLFPSVSEAARAALEHHTSPPTGPTPSPHIVSVQCHACRAVSHFDKREVCPSHTSFQRKVVQYQGIDMDELHLTCQHCGTPLVTLVDCRGYT